MPMDRVEYNAYMAKYLKARYHRQLRLTRELLGGKCCKCGSTKRLEFDHVDPENKSALVTDLTHVSFKRFASEVAKCQLLCKSCHQEKHRAKHPCGDVRKYWRGCRCAECRAANTEHCRAKRAA